LISYWYSKNDLRKWKRNRYFVREELKTGINYLKENLDRDYSEILNKIKIPVLVIQGEKDESIPLKITQKLVRDYKNIKLVIFEKANHNFEDFYIRKKLIKLTAAWFKKYL